MPVREIIARSILRRHRHIDPWFVSWGGMNLYRGCAHDCVYCDGRSEKYRVEGDFAKDIAYKGNALELLKRELDPARKRKPFPGGFLMLGGGVGDLYQPAESARGICRAVLSLIRDFAHPVHILTKSKRVLEDLHLIQEIAREKAALVSFSFSTTDDRLAAQIETGASLPAERLQAMEQCNRTGIPSGAFLMPVLPGLSDSRDHLERSLMALKTHGCRYVVFSGLTLKEGRQKDHYMSFLRRHHPELVQHTHALFPPSPWGSPAPHYMQKINALFFSLATKHELPKRIPLTLFSGITSPFEQLQLIIRQMADLGDMTGTAHGLRKALKNFPPAPHQALDPTSFGNPFVQQLAQELVLGEIPVAYRNWIGGKMEG